MANYFQEDEARPIVSAWIEQGFEIDQGFILEAIEADEQALSQDVTLSAVAAFGSIASGCLMLALAGFSAPMVIPVVALIGSGLVAWNSDCAKGDRELEGRFLREYPQTFDRISQRVSVGEGVATIATEYGQMFRAYRKSDRAALTQLTAETQAQTELQSPASMPTSNRQESIAHSADAGSMVAVAPSMGVSRIMSPLDILIRARFSHRAFYGGQRTGKSYLAAIASQALSLTGIKVFHMNLFSHGPEDKKYWTHAARSVQCDLSSLSPDEALPYIRQAQSILSEFKLTTDALLIIDEITSMGNLRSEHLENLQPFINGLVSYINAIRDSSKKRHKAVWTIAPGIVSAGLDQGVKELIKGLSPVLVSIPKDVSIMWEDQTLTTDMTVYGQLKINYQGISDPPSMDCDRMVLIDNIWMPMGTLPPLTKIAPPSLSNEVPEVQSSSQPIAPPPSESTRSRRGKITIPTRSSSSDARQKLEQAWEVADGEMVDEQPIDSGIEECYEIINGESDTTLRDALMMGFDWYLKEKVNGRELSKDTFINRAKTNRKSERLKEDRQSIWLEVQELISYYESL